MIQAVLFDLDGTLLDTAPDFVHVVNRLRHEHQRPPLPEPVIRSRVSDGARALVQLAFDLPADAQDLEPLRQRLLALYQDHLAVFTRPFPGITELLDALGQRGIGWGVVTNKPSVYTAPLMAAIALRPPHGAEICPDHVRISKPDPEGLLLACQQLGCDPRRTIYVGDHLRDIQAGQAAGMITIAAAYGYVHADERIESWKADFVVQHAGQILSVLDRLCTQSDRPL